MNSPIDPPVKPRTTGTGAAPDHRMTGTEARQGNTGRPVLKVLIAGLVLAAVAWGGAEWWGKSTAPPAEQTATPPAGDNTPATSTAAPSANPAAVPPATPPAGNTQTGN